MKIVIPKKFKKINNYNKDCYHYELVEVQKYIVVYRCVENGFLETFSKNDFIKHEE